MTDNLLHFPATPSPAPPPDHDQRLQAVDPARTFLVQAPAGSGKTTLLTERFLRLLATVDEPEQVLAITFTRAAAQEMRSRIVSALHAAESAPGPATDLGTPAQRNTHQAAQAALGHAARRGWKLLDDPRQLNIQTIDGLALQIASRTPITSRLGPGTTPTENAQGLYLRAAMRTMKKLQHRSSPPGHSHSLAEAAATLLQHRNNQLLPCATLLAEMLASRDQWARLFPLDPGLLTDAMLDGKLRQRLEHFLRQAVEQHLQRLHAWLLAHPTWTADLLPLLRFAAATAPGSIANCAQLDALPEPTAQSLPQWLGLAAFLLTNTGTFRKGFNSSEGFPPECPQKQQAKALVAQVAQDESLRGLLQRLQGLPPAAYTDEQWHLLKAIFRLLQNSVLELQLLFAETGQMDFVEVGLAATQALKSDSRADSEHPSDLALSLGGYYRHLLVDEYQDTSRTQQNFLEALVSAWSFDNASSYFLVGDPMQSIYLFRQAEVRGFTRARHEGLAGVVPELLTLTVNFRSQPELIAEHNRIFASVFSADGEVPFVRAQSFHGQPQLPAVTWHFWPAAARNATPEEKALPRQQEAITIATLIQQAVTDRNCTVAVLVRARNHATRVLQQLSERNIPYRAVEMEELGDRQEVQDVFALTRALLHPADRVAWLSLLRAPWCGLSLAAMDHWLGHQTSLTLAELLQQAVDHPDRCRLRPEDLPRVQHLAQVMQWAIRHQGEMRLPALVWQAWRKLQGHLCVDSLQLTNVESYFAMLEAMDADGTALSRSAIEHRMSKLFAAPDQSPGVQVEVLTIHKAKGREWDIVLVPQMDRRTGVYQSAAVDWLESPNQSEPEHSEPEQSEPDQSEPDAWYVAPLPASGEAKEKLNQWIRRRRTERSHQEVQRLLYVAATRARQSLHLFGAVSLTKDQQLNAPKVGTLLHAAWSTARPEAESQLLTGPALPIPITIQPVPGVVKDMAASGTTTEHAIRQSQPMRLPLSLISQALISQASPAEASSPVAPAKAAPPQPDRRNVRANSDSRHKGTALHAVFQQIATLRQANQSWQQIGQWLRASRPAIAANLVLLGVPMAKAEAAARHVQQLASQALAAPHGQWVLDTHSEARSEFAISYQQEGQTTSVRLDRVFLAGATALADGNSHWWIIDYKSAACTSDEVTEFLATQEAAYSATLQQYATGLRRFLQDRRPIVCALYFPASDLLHVLPAEAATPTG